MNWLEHYQSHIVSAQEAVSHVQNGDRIAYGQATGEPQMFAEALIKRQGELKDVAVIHGLAMGPSVYCGKDVNPAEIYHETTFAGAKTRKAVHEGRATFVPMHFSDMPRYFSNGAFPITVAAIHVSPPDRYGFCSFGVSVDYERAAVETARLVVAEVNPNMPRTYGDSLVHVSEIDYFIESDRRIYEMPRPSIGETEQAIGKHIAGLVEDGACLQLGMGAIPNAIMGFLTDKNDLGIHTELISDGAMDLMKLGVVNNRRKQIHVGKSVATFASGTKELYEWLNANPWVEFYPVQYINNSHIISQNDNVFSVNSALQVDMQGQVCAETINAQQYSGIGGQMDFVRGAAWSKGGKSIIAMPATAKGGEISRIVTTFKPGDAVSTPRNDVDYVVTEFGVAHLKGKNIAERARRLIAIAHPDFRAELKDQFKVIYGTSL